MPADSLVSLDERLMLMDLLAAYAARLDENALDAWLELFAEPAVYTLTTRENVMQRLPGSLLCCEGKDMLRDRVFYLQRGSAYTYTYARHLVSMSSARKLTDGSFELAANFALFQTDLEGESRLFGVGQYNDTVVVQEGAGRFLKKTVVLDTAAIPTLLAAPV
jgi:anthranilate 1,2-dioxygenase small subunit